MPMPWTQARVRSSVNVDGGFFDVTSVFVWWREGHFDSPVEARGAFKLAYQQGLDGMGKSISQWMGIDEKAYDAWMRRSELPCDVIVPQDGREYVYFVRAGDYVKIGTSGRLSARLAGGQTMNALPLKILGTVRGNRRLETTLHKRFEHLRVRGEWFEATPELLAFIDGFLFARTT